MKHSCAAAAVEDQSKCLFVIFSGQDDRLFPVPCSYFQRFTLYDTCMVFSHLQQLPTGVNE